MSEEKIIDAYNKTLLGSKQLTDYLKEKGVKVSYNEVLGVLKKNEGFTLNQTQKKAVKTRKYLVFDVDNQWQADLIEMSSVDPEINGGVRYLLNIIDMFSRYAWSIPLKNKSSASLVEAFDRVFKEAVPKKIQTDLGSEFYNKQVQALFSKHDIELFSVHSNTKCGLVENFNRTMKRKMARLFDIRQTKKYIDKLDDLVGVYNNTIQSTIKMKPIDARKKENYEEVFYNQYGDDDGKEDARNDIVVGDYVRIPVKRNPFTKESVGLWTIEIFTVYKIKKGDVNMYYLEDLMGEKIDGGFYQEELNVVDKTLASESFRIEKIIKKKGNKVLVKWLGYPDKFNSWVNSADVKDLS